MLNSISIQGRLTNDIELKQTNSGLSCCNLTIACERSYSKSGENRQVDFIDVVAWRSTAEFLSKYFKKGDMVIINGSLQTRTYEDKNGVKRKISEILASEVNFCGSKSNSTSNAKNNSYDEPNTQSGNSYRERGLDVSQGEQQAFKEQSSNESDFAVIDDSEDLPF